MTPELAVLYTIGVLGLAEASAEYVETHLCDEHRRVMKLILAMEKIAR